MGRRKTTEEFISEARAVHGDRYDYSKVVYTGVLDKIIITCREHGEFPQKPRDHNRGSGCPSCAGNLPLDQVSFLSRAYTVHGYRYDYSLSVFIKTVEKVCVICKEHGAFYPTAGNHFAGKGCPECAKNVALDTEEFIKRAILLHGSRYDYSKVEYKNAFKKVIITCKVHGDFPQSPDGHLAGKGCSKCSKSGFTALENSVFYVYTFGDYAGFGITSNFKMRHMTHLCEFRKKGLDAKLVAKYNMSGEEALYLEKQIKQTLEIKNSGVIGFKTEAVLLDHLPILLKSIDEGLKTNAGRDGSIAGL